VVGPTGSKQEKNHLRLALSCEGGGTGANGSKRPKGHLRLALACEGGGDGTNEVETRKIHLRLAFAHEAGGGRANGVETRCFWRRRSGCDGGSGLGLGGIGRVVMRTVGECLHPSLEGRGRWYRYADVLVTCHVACCEEC
jgi:hypothetical protein